MTKKQDKEDDKMWSVRYGPDDSVMGVGLSRQEAMDAARPSMEKLLAKEWKRVHALAFEEHATTDERRGGSWNIWRRTHVTCELEFEIRAPKGVE